MDQQDTPAIEREIPVRRVVERDAVDRVEMLINVSDFDPEKHIPVEDETPKAERKSKKGGAE